MKKKPEMSTFKQTVKQLCNISIEEHINGFQHEEFDKLNAIQAYIPKNYVYEKYGKLWKSA